MADPNFLDVPVTVNGTPTEGDDTLFGTAGADLIDGLGGNDVIHGDDGDDTLEGSAGADTLDGGAGIDSLTGGLGDDWYQIDASDVIVENEGEGIDTVEAAFSYTLLADFDNLVLGGAGDIDGTGNTRDNVITGNDGMNLLSGGAGRDTLTGGGGDDTLDGGNAGDSMAGGADNDTYVVNSQEDIVTELAAGGDDLIQSSVTIMALADEVERLTLTGSALNGSGNALNNTITGNASANTLNGMAGNDALAGGTGDDTYVVDAAGDVITEELDAGADLVKTGVTYLLADNVENLTLTGTGAIDGTGNALINTLTGNNAANLLAGAEADDTIAGGGGADTLDGGTGNDSMTGGAGGDTYIVDSVADVVTEVAGPGIDTIQSSVSLSLVGDVENLELTDITDLEGTGNALNNALTGNSGANLLDGLGGNDTLAGAGGDDSYVVDATGDVVIELAGGGVDQIQSSVAITALAPEVEKLILTGIGDLNATGNGLANEITGTAGANVLNGLAGNDILTGGAGDDTYVVDSGGDVVNEAPGEGIDLVLSAVGYSLAPTLEHLTLTGAAPVNGTGNSGANTLTGNNAANLLLGANGADSIVAGGGADMLDGGHGNDALTGGDGNDTYVVDAAGDVVTELVGQGTDLVLSSVNAALGAEVENLTLTGLRNIRGSGNALDNKLNGNDGNNMLDGGAGGDTVRGGAGDDTYVVDAGDVVTEFLGQGMDHVKSAGSYALEANFEILTLLGPGPINGFGNTLDNVITGSSSANLLDGDKGDDNLDGRGGSDVLRGDKGNDTLTGGAGMDTFDFNTNPDDVLNADQITDFRRADDTIQLDHTIFTAIAVGNPGPGAFYRGAAAHDASDRIIYDTTSGNLYYDPDGTGAADPTLFATLTGAPWVAYTDFFVVA